MNDSTKWIGLVEVRDRTNGDLLGANRGAYVTVVAVASDESDFRATVTEALDCEGLIFIDAEEIELQDTRSMMIFLSVSNVLHKIIQ